MASRALQTFDHVIQDAVDLLAHFDSLNTKPPPPQIEVLKRASLVMALAALETYLEDRLVEAVDVICDRPPAECPLATFMRESLANDLKHFHSPSTERVRPLFVKYLGLDVTEAWQWNHMDPKLARQKLNRLVKNRGDIAHRSWRPVSGQAQVQKHAVTRDELRKSIHFVRQLAASTDVFLEGKL